MRSGIHTSNFLSANVITNHLTWKRHLQNDTSTISLKRTVHLSRWPTCIISYLEPLIKGRIIKPALNYHYFFWIVVTLYAK